LPSLPNRIKELRQERGLSQQELAERMNVRQATVSRLENSRMILQQKYIAAAAEALGVEVYEILPQSDQIEWLEVTGEMMPDGRSAIVFKDNDETHFIPFAKDPRSPKGSRRVLEIGAESGSFLIYQTFGFEILPSGEYVVEDVAGEIRIRIAERGSDGRLYLTPAKPDPAVPAICADDANVLGRVIAEYVLK